MDHVQQRTRLRARAARIIEQWRLNADGRRAVERELGDDAARLSAIISIELLRNVALIQKEAESRYRSTSRRERECETRIAALVSKLRKEIAKHPRRWRPSDLMIDGLEHLVTSARDDPQQPRARSAQGTLLVGLIDLWCASGRAVTASVNSEPGPLIRFLIACSSDLFDLTAHGARQRIRTYKRDLGKK